MPLRRADSLTLGLEAHLVDGRVHFFLEAQVRLLPPDSPVDMAELERVLALLRFLTARGFRLHHYDGGWVTAILEIGVRGVEGGREVSDLADEIFYQAGP